MQEALPIGHRSPKEVHDLYRDVTHGLKWLAVGIWRPVRWLLEAMFSAHPAEKYLEENRLKAIRLVGHF